MTAVAGRTHHWQMLGSGLIEEHLAWCRLRGLADTTIASKRDLLRRLACQVNLATATSRDLEAWWTGRDIAITTRAMEVAHVATFYRWLVLTERRPDDPMLKVPKPKVPRPLPRPADEREVAAMIAGAPHPIRDWLTLAAYAGLRAIEIARLRGDDLVAGTLLIRAGKGGKGRIVPAHPRVLEVAASWPAAGMIWQTPTGLEVDAHYVSQTTNKWLRDHGRSATLHQYRARFATQAYNACHDLRAVQELLGHTSPATTQRYVAVPNDAAARAVAGLS